jgi:uncharacterized membrane protein (DUF373 family)
VLYIAVGCALAVAGFALFGEAVYTFCEEVLRRRHPLDDALLSAVDGILLVFIFAELLHTVRVVVAHDELRTEPFLIVGIVAALRRFIVASAEGSKTLGTPLFKDLMIELGVLITAVVLLSIAIWLLRAHGLPASKMSSNASE